jgi:hypothetical protein
MYDTVQPGRDLWKSHGNILLPLHSRTTFNKDLVIGE